MEDDFIVAISCLICIAVLVAMLKVYYDVLERPQTDSFSFWCPSTTIGRKVMFNALFIICAGVFIRGCTAEQLRVGNFLLPMLSILFLYVAPGVVGWYFIFNIGRFVYVQATGGGPNPQ